MRAAVVFVVSIWIKQKLNGVKVFKNVMQDGQIFR